MSAKLSRVVSFKRLMKSVPLASFHRHWWHGNQAGYWSIQLDCNHEIAVTYMPTIGYSIECPVCNKRRGK